MIGMIFGMISAAAPVREFTLTCPTVPDGGNIPSKYAYHGVQGGRNISLPLQWIGAPAGTKSFAVSIIDPHPVAQNWVHWIAIDIPSGISAIPEAASGKPTAIPWRELDNTYGTSGYGGPEPPPGSGAHPYVMTIYALNTSSLDLQKKTGLQEFLRALQGKVLASATTTGYYERK